ncbi:MAG: glucosaminidase domain-containing protein [Aestuariibacter sp.]
MIFAKQHKVIFGLLAAVLLAVGIWFAFFARVPAPDFSQYPAGPERKDAFFSYFEPIVTEVNQELLDDRKRVEEICETETSVESTLNNLAQKYRIDDTDLEDESMCDLLLRRADIIPPSLALAQAANESAWGTSRFAQQGNNFFGQWCFEAGCGLVPKNRDEDKAHEVATFHSPSDSVKSYMLNLNGHDAYKRLRLIRENLRENGEDITGITLSSGLNKYSERGAEYGQELRSMIRYNELTLFDEEPIQ